MNFEEKIIERLKRLEREVERLRVKEKQVFVPLTTPLTSTSWDGDSFSTTAKTKIDLSAVFGVPAGVKAVMVNTFINDSASSNTLSVLILSPNSDNYSGISNRATGLPNDYTSEQTMVVPCDANGDVYYQIVASGTGTMDVHLQIWGYWL